MLPIVELRGAIPVAIGLGLSWETAFILSVIGNFLPVPFLLLFTRKIFSYLRQTKLFRKFVNFVENHAMKKSDKVMKYSALGLFIFVAIPLPGTGAWTGAVIAALLNMRNKYSFPAIFFGIVGAGIIMTIASVGIKGLINFAF